MQVLRFGQKRTTPQLLVLTGLLVVLATATAQAQPSFSYFATNVDSNGRVPGHAGGGDFCNGVMGPYVYAGSPFPVGNIRLVGTAQSSDPMWWATQVDELACSVIIKDSGGVQKAQWNNYNVKPIHAQFWYHNPVSVNVTRDASSLGTIQPGDQIEIRFWESFDDYGGGNPCAAVDATWTNATVTFYPKPATGGGGGDFEVMLATDEALVLHTAGSDYTPVIGIFDNAGVLLALDDGMGGGDPGEPSEILLDGLPPGEYYLAVAGQGAAFDEGFMVMPGDGGGNLVLNYNGGMVEDRTHFDSVFWYRVSLSELVAECPGDLDGDGDVDLGDLASLLAVYGTSCP